MERYYQVKKELKVVWHKRVSNGVANAAPENPRFKRGLVSSIQREFVGQATNKGGVSVEKTASMFGTRGKHLRRRKYRHVYHSKYT